MKNLMILAVACIGMLCDGQVHLSKMFADHMVLQRNQQIPVWGWSIPNDRIEITLNSQSKITEADGTGKWMVKLNPETAGGPYEMKISGKNTISITDVMIGDVWVCSGQSNMEWPVKSSLNAMDEIKAAKNFKIRQFLVGRDVESIPKDKLKEGNWSVCSPESAGNFTAVGYFFAKNLQEELDVPIGLINTTWGGTNIETWISRNAFEEDEEFKSMISGMPNMDIESILEPKMSKVATQIEKIQNYPIIDEKRDDYAELEYDDTAWPSINAPELWESQQLENFDGTVWYRKSIELTENDVLNEAVLELSKIDDIDITYVNGYKVGSMQRHDLDRIYQVPSTVLQKGKNVIAIRITDNRGGGGIYGDESKMRLKLNNRDVILSGLWKFRVTAVQSSVSPNEYPSLLFNAMIHPLIPFAIKGVIWYQGEANVNRASQYKKAFPLMISDWRNQWGQGEFPFYFVQLSSFNDLNGNPIDGSMWAELREAQTYTLENVDHAGMAVTTDIGNANDIHPRNKQDVGKRLAAIALKNDYHRDIIASGPKFKSMSIHKDKVILTFENINDGLMTPDKYGYVKGFSIAGKDKKFYYAKASVKDDTVVVHHDSVTDPVAVRYGWSDDAGDANLYNENGFPAIPFRTDSWKTLTEGEVYSIDD